MLGASNAAFKPELRLHTSALIPPPQLRQVGIDPDVEASQRRGLTAVPMVAGGTQGPELVTGSLRLALAKGPYDAVMLQGEGRGRRWPTSFGAWGSGAPRLQQTDSGLQVMQRLHPIARVCAKGPSGVYSNKNAVFPPSFILGTSLELADKPGLKRWWQQEPLLELLSMFGEGEEGQPTGGLLCADVVLEDGLNPAAIFNSLHDCGVSVWKGPGAEY